MKQALPKGELAAAQLERRPGKGQGSKPFDRRIFKQCNAHGEWPPKKEDRLPNSVLKNGTGTSRLPSLATLTALCSEPVPFFNGLLKDE